MKYPAPLLIAVLILVTVAAAAVTIPGPGAIIPSSLVSPGPVPVADSSEENSREIAVTPTPTRRSGEVEVPMRPYPRITRSRSDNEAETPRPTTVPPATTIPLTIRPQSDDDSDTPRPAIPQPTLPQTTVPPVTTLPPVTTMQPTPVRTDQQTDSSPPVVTAVRTVYVYPSGSVYLPSYYYPPYYSYTINGYTPTSSMTVTSFPSNAIVIVDGYNSQTTPWVFTNILPGYHTVEINYPGYEPYITNVFVDVDESPTVHANLITRREYGSLFINSTPRGADVFVDGNHQGTTPVTVEGVSQGPHQLELHLAGYEVLTRTVSVVAGQGNSMNYVLSSYSSSSRYGSIDIQSDIPGAVIYLDGTYKGSTTAGRTFNLISISPGSHTLLLHVPGYNDFVQTVQVAAGQVARVNAVFSQATGAPAQAGGSGAGNSGSIVASSSPAGAEVYLDNQFRGVAPVTIYNVPPGAHIVNMKLNGYADWSSSTDVPSGQVTQVAASLAPGTAGTPSPTRAALPVTAAIAAAGAGAVIVSARRRV